MLSGSNREISIVLEMFRIRRKTIWPFILYNMITVPMKYGQCTMRRNFVWITTVFNVYSSIAPISTHYSKRYWTIIIMTLPEPGFANGEIFEWKSHVCFILQTLERIRSPQWHIVFAINDILFDTHSHFCFTKWEFAYRTHMANYGREKKIHLNSSMVSLNELLRQNRIKSIPKGTINNFILFTMICYLADIVFIALALIY